MVFSIKWHERMKVTNTALTCAKSAISSNMKSCKLKYNARLEIMHHLKAIGFWIVRKKSLNTGPSFYELRKIRRHFSRYMLVDNNR